MKIMHTVFFTIFTIYFLLCKGFSLPSVKIHSCGDDLKYLVNYVCTYPEKTLPCFSHFLNNSVTKEENPLQIIDTMKQKLLQNGYEDAGQPFTPTPLFNKNYTLIEKCCHIGCNISEVKKKYCCFSQKCLDLCYPEKFDVFV